MAFLEKSARDAGEEAGVRALVISPQPFFSPRGTPFSVYYRSRVMAELGVEQDLLTYGEGMDVDLPGVRIVRIPRFSFLGAVKTGPSVLKLFLDVFMIFWTVTLLLRNRYDFVHAHEEAVFWCRMIKPLFGFRLVYDMHSSLPQQLENFEFSRSRALRVVFEWLENSALRNADGVITICPDLRDYVRGIKGVRGAHALIENSIFEPVRLSGGEDETEPTPKPDTLDPVRSSLGPCLVYAGTLESYQGIDVLLRAARRLIEDGVDAHLLIIGGRSDQVAEYQGLAERIGVAARVQFTGRLPKSHADELTARADVLLSPRTSGTNTPLKIYQQLASGIPIVATNIFSHTQILTDDVAFLGDPTPEALASCISAAISEPDEARRRAEAARKLYESDYAREVYVNKLRRFLGAVLGAKICAA
jgi:glycosyltransferase involved in cell wall biosynthesis